MCLGTTPDAITSPVHVALLERWVDAVHQAMLEIRYAFAAGLVSATQCRVERFSGREGVNRYYAFEIELATPLPVAAFEPLVLGQRARFALVSGERTRVVHGIVGAITSLSVATSGTTADPRALFRYRVKLVPRAQLLKRRKASRIFQDESASSALGAVLADARVRSRFALDPALPTRSYLTQFDETDDAFLRRLCAENGLLFYFEQPPSVLDADLGAAFLSSATQPLVEVLAAETRALLREIASQPTEETIVFTNGAAYPPMRLGTALDLAGELLATGGIPNPSLHYRDTGAMTDATEDHWVSSTIRRRSVRPTRARYREFDPDRPLTELESLLPQEDDGPTGAEPLELYEHDGPHLFPDWGYATSEPTRMLKRARRDELVIEADSSCPRVEAGHAMQFEDHASAELNGVFVPIDVRHEGSATFGPTTVQTAYRNRMSCIPGDVPYLARGRSRRPVHVCQTATVIGSEEIDTNARGQIRVRFHWDRRPSGDASTCWIRTLQSWAGAAWGSQFLPRLGMEVVVVFEAGDPDRPIILGCVQNGVLPGPFALPAEKSKSGFRTQSTPRGEGYNELSFDDAAGAELLHMRAQRDLEVRVGRHRETEVQADDRLIVQHDQHISVVGQMSESAGARRTQVGTDELHVRQDASVDIRGGLHEHVHGTRRLDAGAEARSVGQSTLEVEADLAARVRGSATMGVGTRDAPRSATLSVEGTVLARSTKSLLLKSDDSIVLQCGDSFIRVTDGGIELSGPKITLRTEDARMSIEEGEIKSKVSSTFQVVSDDVVVLRSSGAGIALQSQVKVDGSQILLNSPAQATDTIESHEPETTIVELVDQDGNAVPYERFVIRLDDGSEQMGFLDADGRAVVDVVGSGKIVFFGVSEVESA